MNPCEILEGLAAEYPPALVAGQLADVDRIAFHIQLATDGIEPGGSVIDLGGGIGLFSVGCATLGYSATVIDDFRDPVNEIFGTALDVHDAHGVAVISADLVANPNIEAADDSIDVVTTFESIEHWHGSPRTALQEAIRVLKPGGRFILSVPNSVNLRKRITVPFGRGKWSPFDTWYENRVFRSHIRECDIDDLHRINDDLGLVGTQFIGRNWSVYAYPQAWVRKLGRPIDLALRLRPSLCFELYMVGSKPRTRSEG